MGYIPFLWLLLAAGFILAELFTSGFVLCWFGAGAIVAALIAFTSAGLGWQILAFILVSAALTMASRTIFERYLSRFRSGGGIKTGMESLPGQVGTVVEGSAGSLHRAAVQVYGSTWTAYPAAGEEPLTAGDPVEVERVDDSILYVRKVGSSPSWRAEGGGTSTSGRSDAGEHKRG